MNNLKIKFVYEETNELKRYFKEKAKRNYMLFFDGHITENEFKEREKEIKKMFNTIKSLDNKLSY